MCSLHSLGYSTQNKNLEHHKSVQSFTCGPVGLTMVASFTRLGWEKKNNNLMIQGVSL
jgi:hypothetical protein